MAENKRGNCISPFLCQSNNLQYFCIVKCFMETGAYIESKEDSAKTPESELMSVEEYFDIVWHRYIEKTRKIVIKD